MSVRFKSFTSVLIAACAMGTVAAAQPMPGQGSPERPAGFDPARARERFQARTAERVRALHDVLGIRPDQEGAFAAFIAATQRHGGPDQGRRDAGESRSTGAMTTPQRLDAMQARMDARIAEMHERFQRLSTATKALYAVLDARQQRVMDALPELRGHGGKGWDRHGMSGARPE